MATTTIDVRDSRELSYEEFLKSYLEPNEAVMIQNMCKYYGRIRHWLDKDRFDWDAFAKGISDRHVSVCDTRLDDIGTCSEGMLVSEFCDLMQHDERSQTKYLKDWHYVKETDDLFTEPAYTVPEYFQDDWMNFWYTRNTDDDFRFVYIGGCKSVTYLHSDVFMSYSFSVNIHGFKTWYIFPPSSRVDLFLEPLLREARYSDVPVDIRLWDQETFAKALSLGLRVIRQGPGDAIFVPSRAYHQVVNESQPTVSFNHNWCNATNIFQMAKSLLKEDSDVRDSIDDLRSVLSPQDWETEVSNLLKLHTGWDWHIFWDMIRQVLLAPAIPHEPQREFQCAQINMAFDFVARVLPSAISNAKDIKALLARQNAMKS